MKIWIEHEVWVLEQSKALSARLSTNRPYDMLNVYTGVPNPYQWGDTLSVAFDKEYYQTQYEVKFAPFDPKIENITFAAEYFEELYWKYDWIQNKWPDFVWTHIHIFDNYSPSSKWHLQVVERVFQEMADFWYEKYEDPRIANHFKRAELKRLCTSNNLLKYLDYNIFGWRLYKILNNIGMRYQYSDVWNLKSKYAPVIWSPSRWGKQYSLELRYVSNTYFLLEKAERIKKLVEDSAEIIRTFEWMEVDDIERVKIMLKSIFSSFIKLTSLLYGIENDWSLLNVKKLIQQSSSLAEPNFSEDRLRFIWEVNMNGLSDDSILQTSQELRSNSETRRPSFRVLINDTHNPEDDWWGNEYSDDTDDEELDSDWNGNN